MELLHSSPSPLGSAWANPGAPAGPERGCEQDVRMRPCDYPGCFSLGSSSPHLSGPRLPTQWAAVPKPSAWARSNLQSFLTNTNTLLPVHSDIRAGPGRGNPYCTRVQPSSVLHHQLHGTSSAALVLSTSGSQTGKRCISKPFARQNHFPGVLPSYSSQIGSKQIAYLEHILLIPPWSRVNQAAEAS